MISEVVMARMLMPLFGERLEGGGGDAGVAAHADADDRDLRHAGLALQHVEADRVLDLGEHGERLVDVARTAR